MNFFIELREGLAIAWAAIRANKLRSVLTTLGIVIGILTVTLMGTAITGLNRAFMKSISVIGADVFYVSRISWFTHSYEEWQKVQKRRPITLAQIRELERQLTQASAVAPEADTSATVSFGARQANNVSVIGSNEQLLQTIGLTISDGRFFSPVEAQGGRPVCVIGWQVATNLFPRGGCLGEKVKIGDRRYEVVGVLEKQGSFLDGGSLDNQAIIPLNQFNSFLVNSPEYMAQVRARDLGRLDDAREELRAVLRKIRHVPPGDPDDFSINQQDQFVQMFHQVAGTIASVGLFITGLSLFVGGIGIMNIMFVSVAERTREIGVRKAIGAKRRTILIQFLIEAASICLIGGALGIALAWPLTLIMEKFFPATLSPVVVALALSVSLITGLLSGFFPAWRAARMNPIDALRNE